MTAIHPHVPDTVILGNLSTAQAHRCDRARLHHEVKALAKLGGCARAAELVLDPPPELETLAIFDLLCWIRQIGRSQARGILRTVGPIGERRQLREMTPRQRAAVAAHLLAAAQRAGSR